MEMMYSLDNIGLLPAKLSSIRHRSEVNPYVEGKLPIFISPMTSIINNDNFEIFNSSKVIPIHPRTESLNKYMIPSNDWISMSLCQFKAWFNGCKAPGDHHFKILIDIANGHMQEIYDCVRDAKQKYGKNLTVMIGNIAHPSTYIECCKAGVDYVRVGIGGGSACTTGVQTGIHASMVWLLTEIHSIKQHPWYYAMGDAKLNETFDAWIESNNYTRTKVIVDGGINTIDKAIKCLALGADYVMMGKLFAQCEEACGKTTIVNYGPNKGSKLRQYYGMASEQGQKDISGGVKKNPEGIETWVPIKYTLEELLSKFEAALTSCMSYCNATNLNSFIGKVEWYPMTSSEFKAYYK